MLTVDGRRFASREDLIEQSGYSLATIRSLWHGRDSNGHPRAHMLDGIMHWDLETWSAWLDDRNLRSQRTDRIDWAGAPDEELTPSAQARVLGVDVSRITQYGKNPPPGWPAPVRVEQLPTRVREYRTRRQLWAFVALDDSRVGTPGGRPSGPDPRIAESRGQRPDSRVEAAANALAGQPGRTAGAIAGDLAELHGGSVHTWKRIVTQARRQEPL
ncbi:hypothetical protein ACPXCP_38995 [Streptomyces sp. DT20]|uniref:hypothetical protein n=1 Tax=Streptomyces sp. DT20 TaxID=3416519 RepID=UPI003CED5237